MYEISSNLYEETARKLLDAIGGDSYFSGSVVFPFDDVECRLTASLVVYRSKGEMPEGAFEAIDDIVPVWWEFATVCDGSETLNDFSFGTLKEFML